MSGDEVKRPPGVGKGEADSPSCTAFMHRRSSRTSQRPYLFCIPAKPGGTAEHARFQTDPADRGDSVVGGIPIEHAYSM